MILKVYIGNRHIAHVEMFHRTDLHSRQQLADPLGKGYMCLWMYESRHAGMYIALSYTGMTWGLHWCMQ